MCQYDQYEVKFPARHFYLSTNFSEPKLIYFNLSKQV